MSKMLMPKCRRAYRFDYPKYNFHQVLSLMLLRRLFVESIRDVTKDHLDPKTTEIQPLLQRGQWLVTGIDLDKGEERSFYLESMRRLEPI